MLKRIIPILLLQEDNLVKTKNFKDPKYIGDPINAIKIFNDKLVDEIIVLDTQATLRSTPVQFELLREMAGECFMPLSYGGGLHDLNTIRKVIQSGVEKVVITTGALEKSGFIRDAAQSFGTSTIVVGIDYRTDIFGRSKVMTHAGSKATSWDPVKYAQWAENEGAGEIVLQCIDKEGTMKGYDLSTLEKVLSKVNIPVIVSGGAGTHEDLRQAFKAGATAAAAGSLFVFKGNRNAILINYPRADEIEKIIG